MKERIKLIMENENLTPAKFADRLQINRAIISHILNERNNPSLDVVTKILGEMNYINPEWLLNGTGNMYKNGINTDSIPKEPDLFHQTSLKSEDMSDEVEKRREIELKQTVNSRQTTENKLIETLKSVDKKITQIIIYYNDHTFETFTPH
jgi:Helix-turn-helix.